MLGNIFWGFFATVRQVVRAGTAEPGQASKREGIFWHEGTKGEERQVIGRKCRRRTYGRKCVVTGLFFGLKLGLVVDFYLGVLILSGQFCFGRLKNLAELTEQMGKLGEQPSKSQLNQVPYWMNNLADDRAGSGTTLIQSTKVYC